MRKTRRKKIPLQFQSGRKTKEENKEKIKLGGFGQFLIFN